MTEPPLPKRGFSCNTNARDAALKNIKLGTAHQFTRAEAQAAGRKGAESRWGARPARPMAEHRSSR